MIRLYLVLILLLVLQACVSDDDQISVNNTSSSLIDEKSKQLGCHLTIAPGSSFESAFSKLKKNQLLCLQDGIYNQVMNIPSDTHVRALNDGQAEIDGRKLNAGWKGVLMLTGENSSVRGLKVHHASHNAKACLIKGKNNHFNVMSCSHGGSYKHAIPMAVSGTGHLIENSWFYGEGRYLLMCYQGENTTIRGNVFRWDKTKENEPNEPNASMSNYSCSDMIWENNISLDYGQPETFMKHCGDFCMSTTHKTANTNVQYLGNIVINHDPDTGNSFGLRGDQKSSERSSDITIKDMYVRGAKVGIAFNPKYKNITIERCTMIDVLKPAFVGRKKTSCNNNADIKFKYMNGIKTNQLLWPWLNEALIKKDMCDKNERQSEWCVSGKSLTDYVLNQ